LGVGLYHAGARGALRPDDHGAVSVSLASGTRHKTLEECARCGRVAGESNSPLAAVWLHGKLLYALMLERRMRRQLGDSLGRLGHERVGTWWRVWGMLKDELAPMITGALFWKEDAWAACLKVLMERPRRRQLQQLPPAALDVLYRCDASQQE